MLGAVAGCPITASFDGDASLRKRPMRRVLEPLERIGARYARRKRRPPAVDSLPARAIRSRSSTSRRLRRRSSNRRCCSPGLRRRAKPSSIEAEATRDHTEKMLTHFGADVRVEPHGAHGRRITLVGPARTGAAADRRSGRSVVGRFSAGGGGDHARLRCDSRRRDAQSVARRSDRYARRDGRRDRAVECAQRRRRRGRRSARPRRRAARRRGAGRRGRRR